MNSIILQIRVALKNQLGHFAGIISLAIGLSVFLMIYRFIESESAYDIQHNNYQNIYRVVIHLNKEGVDLGDASVQFPLAKQFQTDYAGIESTLRIYREPNFPLFQYNENKFIESRSLFVDSNFFLFLNFPLLEGEPSKVLVEPNSVVLTRSTAVKYFGQETAIGKTILYKGTQPLQVTGVVDETKVLSHVKFDILIPLEFYFNNLKAEGNADRIENWLTTFAWTYARFSTQESKEIVDKKLPDFVNAHFPESLRAQASLELQPIHSIHTSSHWPTEIEPNSSDLYLIIFMGISIVTLVFSSINFINLNSSVILNRAKEFSVKGIMGSTRSELLKEIFISTLRLAIVSLVVAIIISMALQQSFNLLMGVYLPMLSLPVDWQLFLILISLVTIIAFISSLYPFYIISSNKYLATALNSRGVAFTARKIAVGIQVACSFVLVFGTLVIAKQMSFFENFDLGFNDEHVIILPFRQSIADHYEVFKEEIKANKNFTNVSWGADVPGLGGVTNYRFVPDGFRIEQPLFIPLVQIDYDFVETMGIIMKEGRDFDSSIPGDSAKAYIVNQAFLKTVGWTDDYMGRVLRMYRPGSQEIGFEGKIVGSFEDYRMESLHFPEKPMIMALKHTYSHDGSFLIKATSINEDVINHLKFTWQVFEKEWPFEYKILSNELERLYRNESKLFSLTMILSAIAILVSLLGILGMNSMAIVRQYKTISIKKVLGARSSSLTWEVLSSEIKFLFVIFILAVPVGYFILSDWLSSFENRIGISFMEVAGASLIISFLVLITVSLHLVKMNQTNPLHHIRKD